MGGLLLRAATTSRSRRGGDLPRRAISRTNVAIDIDHVANYAKICGFRFADTLPTTYLHMLAFPLSMTLMVDDDFPFALPGLVHVANRITVHRNPTLDQRVDISVAALNLRDHDKGRQFDVVAIISQDGEPLWDSSSTYLKRGKTSLPAAPDAPNEVDTVDVKELPLTAIWTVPANIGRRYGAVSGDRNPIHLHALSARPLGFSTAIAHGMWTAARAVAALQGRLPSAYTYDVTFRKPVELPSTVHYASRRDGDRWHLGIRSRKGSVHLQGLVAPVAP